MLDFYLLADDQDKPDYPEEAGCKMIGSLNDQIFERLKVKKIIPERFDYYTDFRWDTVLVRQISAYIQQQAGADGAAQVLSRLLDIANESDSGLVAYAD